MLKTHFKLKNGIDIPSLGFGTWQLLGDKCYRAVLTALETGYKLIDTASIYGNHREVGKAITQSQLKREDLFITSKVWRTDLETKDTIASGYRALEELNLSYLDLYLIHWPNREVPIEKTFAGLEQLKAEGIIKAFGVSNFTIQHLKEVLASGHDIVNNQVEFHPSLNQNILKDYCDKHNIILTAYSPIAQGYDLTLPLIQKLAIKYKHSTAQVILNWLICKGLIAIPRSADPDHIRDNFKALEWELDKSDIAAIDAIDGNRRTVNPPFGEFEDSEKFQ